MSFAALVVVAVAAATAPALAAPRAPELGAQVVAVVHYVPPVDAPVIDGFRLPEGPYGPGNRGWEYDTAPGTPVAVAADGTVSFGGPVGGVMAITVQHDDGLRTSYTNLSDQQVRAGDRVRQGQILGHSAGRLHFGLRRGDVYLDPASILGSPSEPETVKIHVRLVSGR